jgi:AmmeMemoRadiSam system protein A
MDYVDPEALELSDGLFLVRLARKAIREYLRSGGGKVINPPEDTPPKLLRPGASFVTITKPSSEGEELRGCIGYTRPVETLALNVIHAAIAAATQDPRFPPLSLSELNSCVIEVSVLSVPEPLSGRGEDYLKQFVIGRDGLIVEKGFYSGLLLPEVPVEYCWDEETFLSETCIKAGLDPSCWLDNDVKVFRFRTRSFKEVAPGGDVRQRNLKEEYTQKCGPQ